MGAIEAPHPQQQKRSRAIPWGAGRSPVTRGSARCALPKRRGRIERQTRHCEALGVLMRAEATRTRSSPRWLGNAVASSLAPVVETTLAPAMNEEPPASRTPLQARRHGGPKGPVDPPQ
jgi:hypothetical protein